MLLSFFCLFFCLSVGAKINRDLNFSGLSTQNLCSCHFSCFFFLRLVHTKFVLLSFVCLFFFVCQLGPKEIGISISNARNTKFVFLSFFLFFLLGCPHKICAPVIFQSCFCLSVGAKRNRDLNFSGLSTQNLCSSCSCEFSVCHFFLLLGVYQGPQLHACLSSFTLLLLAMTPATLSSHTVTCSSLSSSAITPASSLQNDLTPA